MMHGREQLPDPADAVATQVGDEDTGIAAQLRDHPAPGIDQRAVSVGLATVDVETALGGSQHERLILDGTGTQQDVPVRLPGLRGEGSGHCHEFRALIQQPAEEFREAEIVTDARPIRPKGVSSVTVWSPGS